MTSWAEGVREKLTPKSVKDALGGQEDVDMHMCNVYDVYVRSYVYDVDANDNVVVLFVYGICWWCRL